MQLNLRRNSLYALAEVIVSGIVLFFLYKKVVGTLGVKALGIWSLVLATTSLGRVADIGAAAGLARFVAAASARKDSGLAIHYVQTAALTNLAVYTAVAVLMWAPAFFGLSFVLSGDSLVVGRQLLPFSLISFVLMGLSTATIGAIVGQLRSDQKSMISIGGLVVQYSIAALLVKAHGLVALAWAQIAQYALTFTVSWQLVQKNHLGSWTLRSPIGWRRDIFKELLGFGLRLQAVSVVSMVYEPSVKFLMSNFGGLEAVGFLEMAQRLILQLRQLVVMPCQTLMPVFAHLWETEPARLGPLYSKALNITLILGFALMAGVALGSPLISIIWIGHIERTFVALVGILSIGLFANLLAAPAYLLGVGVGYVKWNLIGACVTTGGSCLFGYILGYCFGRYGVAAAASAMLAAGSSLTLVMNCRHLDIPALPHGIHFRNTVEEAYSLLLGKR